VCLGFAQDRVNFHQKPGGDKAWWLTQTGQTKQGIGYHVPSCWVPVGKLASGSE